MAGTFQSVNVFFRTVVLLALALLAGWWTLFLRAKLGASERDLEARTAELTAARSDLEERRLEIQRLGRELESRAAEIRRLEVVVAEQEQHIRALELANRLLKVQHRVARLEILAQGAPADEPERVRTTVRFTELGPDGAPLAPGQELTVAGRRVYVESLVIQFEDRYVEQGDALRGTSLCLFQRLFGEDQKPVEGVALDARGQQPAIYGGDTTPDPVHGALWERFWDYASDPTLARELGVRALQGEAPFVEARVGKTYRLELRASGGLVIVPE
ncbi:MAG TPA: hypothetical protein VF530_14760 [Planctomycetota bacterium]